MLRAVMSDDLPDERGALRGKTIADCVDVWFRASEWLAMSMDPEVRAMARRMHEVGTAIKDHRTDREGRAPNVGQALGIQSGGPSAARQEIARKRRDDLLRHVRQAVPAWRGLSNRAAGHLMFESFSAYCANPPPDEAGRETARQAEPDATWWRLARLDIDPKIPGRSTLMEILKDP
jgi:hypothetical protein